MPIVSSTHVVGHEQVDGRRYVTESHTDSEGVVHRVEYLAAVGTDYVAVREALRSLDLESLAGRPIQEIFVGLADYICPGAGTVDEGIAREAYIKTIIELATEGLTDLSTFTPDQMQTVFELYATHAIEARICNDIGTKAVTMPTDVQAAHKVEAQLRDFIRGGVSDALTRARAESPNLTPERIQSFVDTVYESAFSILQTLGQAEAEAQALIDGGA